MAIAFKTGEKFKFEENEDIYTFLYIQYNRRNECMLFYSDENDEAHSRKITSLQDLKKV